MTAKKFNNLELKQSIREKLNEHADLINENKEAIENISWWDMLKSVYDPANWEKQVAFSDELDSKADTSSVIEWDYSISAEGTALYLPFNSTDYNFTANTIADRWPYTKNNGTLTNFTRNDWTVSGGVTIEGEAMKFNWVDWRVVATWIDFWNSVTFWWKFKINSTFSWIARLFQNSRWYWLLYNSTTWFASRRGDWGTWEVSVWNPITDFNKYYNVYWTFDWTNLSLYVDWILIWTTTSWPWTISYTTSRWITLSCRDANNQSTNLLDWKIDCVRNWNKILTTQQIEIEGQSKFAVEWDWLVLQYSGRDFTWTTSAPATIIDTNMIVSNGEREGIRFDWVDNYIDIPNWQLVTWDKLTVNFFLKIAPGIWWYVLSDFRWYQFHIRGASAFAMRFVVNWSFVQVANAEFANNEYRLITMTYNWSQIEAFIDWASKWTTALTWNISYNVSREFNIGRWDAGLGGYTDCQITWLSVLNRVMSEEEILAYSQRTKQLFTDVSWVSGSFWADQLSTKEWVVMFAPNGNRFRVSIDNSWALTTTAL